MVLFKYLRKKRYRVRQLIEIGVLGVDRMDVIYCIGTHYKGRIMFTNYPGIAKGSSRKEILANTVQWHENTTKDLALDHQLAGEGILFNFNNKGGRNYRAKAHTPIGHDQCLYKSWRAISLIPTENACGHRQEFRFVQYPK